MDTSWNQHSLSHDSTGIPAYSSFHQQLNKNQGGFLIAHVQNINLSQWKKQKEKKKSSFRHFPLISFEFRLWFLHCSFSTGCRFLLSYWTFLPSALFFILFWLILQLKSTLVTQKNPTAHIFCAVVLGQVQPSWSAVEAKQCSQGLCSYSLSLAHGFICDL